MEPNIFTIFLGDEKTMYLKAVQAVTCGASPLDLTDASEISVGLPKADGTTLHLLLSDDDVVVTEPAVLGAFTVPISAANSALLNVGELQDFVATFTFPSAKVTARFSKALTVSEP